MQLDDVKKGLESGELFEGNIRISQKCPTEAYVPSPVRNLCETCVYNILLLIFYRINQRIY